MEFPTVNIYDDVSSSSEDNIDITNIHPVPKKTRGRRKIQMKKIKKDTDMMVTFSKRRFGIYKKASELVTLTGSEIAFLVFSPAGNAFTFAHPSFDFLVTKYLGIQHLDPSIISYETIHVLQQDRINELTVRYTNSLKNLENEQRKEKDLSARCHGKSLNNWWNIGFKKDMIHLHRARPALPKNHTCLSCRLLLVGKTSRPAPTVSSTLQPPSNPPYQHYDPGDS